LNTRLDRRVMTNSLRLAGYVFYRLPAWQVEAIVVEEEGRHIPHAVAMVAKIRGQFLEPHAVICRCSIPHPLPPLHPAWCIIAHAPPHHPACSRACTSGGRRTHSGYAPCLCGQGQICQLPCLKHLNNVGREDEHGGPVISTILGRQLCPRHTNERLNTHTADAPRWKAQTRNAGGRTCVASTLRLECAHPAQDLMLL